LPRKLRAGARCMTTQRCTSTERNHRPWCSMANPHQQHQQHQQHQHQQHRQHRQQQQHSKALTGLTGSSWR
jgi:hypothetical protein